VAFRSTNRRWVWLIALCSLASPNTAPSEVHDEDRVKAAVVIQLTKFVEWPPRTVVAGSFRACVAGKETWALSLEEAAKGQTVGGKPIQVQRVRTRAEASSCHLLLLGPELKETTRLEIMKSPALTVSDVPGFSVEGGMVEIAVEDGRVVFNLAPRAALRQGIRFSSKLIRLANIVEAQD